MLWRSLAAGAVAVLGLFAWSAAARAGDTVRLDLKGGAAPAITLGYDGDADMDLVHRRFYGGYYGGYRPYVGFYPRYSYYYAPRYVYGYSYYRPNAYYYAPPAYYAPPVYYSYPAAPCYYPMGLTAPAAPFVTSLSVGGLSLSLGNGAQYRPPVAPVPQAPPAQSMPPADGTFPYDGGPRNLVPMPKADPAPMGTPSPSAPLEGRAVSLPSKPAKLTYPAYGEKSAPTDDRVLVNRKRNDR